jgi:hypothetical protein
MSKRVSVIAVVVASVLACGSDPAPAPVSPPMTASGTVGAQGAVAPVATTPPTTPPAASPSSTPATDPSKTDIVACLGNFNPKATDACKSCMATSCIEPIKTLAAACPDFTKCVCDGKAMTECAQSMTAPACMQPGMGVGMCGRQSCAAQCPSHASTAATATTQGAATGSAPAATSGDPCTDLTACCAQVPGGAPPSCAKLVASKNAQACTSLLTMFRNMNKCH